MIQNDVYAFFKPYLNPEETVLWCGVPSPGRLKIKVRIPLLFWIIWFLFLFLLTFTLSGGFLLLEAWTSLDIRDILLIDLILLILLILSIVIYKSIMALKLKGKIFYVVTDKRLLIREGKEIKIFTSDMLSLMQICMNRNGTGTILLIGSNYNHRGYWHKYVCCSLQNLADISQAQSALNSMMSSSVE